MSHELDGLESYVEAVRSTLVCIRGLDDWTQLVSEQIVLTLAEPLRRGGERRALRLIGEVQRESLGKAEKRIEELEATLRHRLGPKHSPTECYDCAKAHVLLDAEAKP